MGPESAPVMIGLDTNVLIRQITRDDPVQTEQALVILDSADDGQLWVSLVVLAEVAWVLHRAYRYAPATVFAAIERILNGREFMVEKEGLARQALANARSANCGYADAVIELLSVEAGATTTLTFDIKAKRIPTMRDAASYQ